MTAPERDWDEQDQRPASAQTEPDTWARRLDRRAVVVGMTRNALTESEGPSALKRSLRQQGINVTASQAHDLLDLINASDECPEAGCEACPSNLDVALDAIVGEQP